MRPRPMGSLFNPILFWRDWLAVVAVDVLSTDTRTRVVAQAHAHSFRFAFEHRESVLARVASQVRGPFLFEGNVAGFARDDPGGLAPVFQLALDGTGIAGLHLSKSEDGVYVYVCRYCRAHDPRAVRHRVGRFRRAHLDPQKATTAGGAGPLTRASKVGAEGGFEPPLDCSN
jgi:hypothetical protein